jgi:putative endonuclease
LPYRRGELRLGKPIQIVASFFYVYILQSEIDAERFYTGLTDDLSKRFMAHNAGRVLHTAKWKPWRLKAYVAVRNRVRAAGFERYLKSASGRAFVKKRR